MDIQKLTPMESYECEQRKADIILILSLAVFTVLLLAILGFAWYGFLHAVGIVR
jgi:hypothetical protein